MFIFISIDSIYTRFVCNMNEFYTSIIISHISCWVTSWSTSFGGGSSTVARRPWWFEAVVGWFSAVATCFLVQWVGQGIKMRPFDEVYFQSAFWFKENLYNKTFECFFWLLLVLKRISLVVWCSLRTSVQGSACDCCFFSHMAESSHWGFNIWDVKKSQWLMWSHWCYEVSDPAWVTSNQRADWGSWTHRFWCTHYHY